MTITATFSNGFTDTYKGARAVKAAWMITRKSDGKVLASGHSLDTDKARKTAEGKLAYFSLSDFGFDSTHPLYYFKGVLPLSSSRERVAIRAHNAARLDLIRSLTAIEIVAL